MVRAIDLAIELAGHLAGDAEAGSEKAAKARIVIDALIVARSVARLL